MKAGQLTTLLSLLILTGCGALESVDKVTSKAIIDKATEQCAPNGGLFGIINASAVYVYESCGPKCLKNTGRVTHTGEAVCQNSARFKMSFSVQEQQSHGD